MKGKKPLWAPIAWIVAFAITTVVIVAEIILNLIIGILRTIVRSLLGGVKRYSKLLGYLYKKMRPVAVCEICHKQGKLELFPCCNRWAHDTCHLYEALSDVTELLDDKELVRMMKAAMN